MKKIAFRMDDVGAASKKYEVYSKYFLGNFLVLKYLPPFKAWAPYRELEEPEWTKIIGLLKKYHSHMTVAITASWVNQNGELTPFPIKFPKEAELIKRGLKEGVLEVANHGLTHSVVGKHKPALFKSNRKYHREFWDWLPETVHKSHLEQSQKILQDYFGKIITFVPPGNVWTDLTWEYAQKNGLKYLSSREGDVFAFHDRDVVISGIDWLENKIKEYKKRNYEIVSIKEIHDCI